MDVPSRVGATVVVGVAIEDGPEFDAGAVESSDDCAALGLTPARSGRTASAAAANIFMTDSVQQDVGKLGPPCVVRVTLAAYQADSSPVSG